MKEEILKSLRNIKDLLDRFNPSLTTKLTESPAKEMGMDWWPAHATSSTTTSCP